MPPMAPPETLEIAGLRIALRRGDGDGVPVVFVHGNPSSSWEWMPFAERLASPAIAFDLPGFGDSERPDPGRFDGTLESLARWIGEALDELGLDRFKLVVHDWGAIALQPAAERADRVERLVVINAVPLFAGYRWHWVGRVWRTPRLGEAFTATTSKPLYRTVLRLARPGLQPMPDDWVEETWRHFDEGTRRAVLSLYRSADPDRLGAAGARLRELRCPALVVWGERDPYIGAAWGSSYAGALPNAELLEVDRAGHWPWIDRPELIGRIAGFLDRPQDAGSGAASPAESG